ncbi:MAG: hypothetical protein EBT27_10420 [Betaproteobacteria bacterium]|nr:hypothetical protein [Betaproteobacteria bacterium]
MKLNGFVLKKCWLRQHELVIHVKLKSVRLLIHVRQLRLFKISLKKLLTNSVKLKQNYPRAQEKKKSLSFAEALKN